VTSLLTPKRRRGIELLDDPAVSPEIMTRSMRDVERANSLFGGTRAVIAELRKVFGCLPSRATLLDVGTGNGDIANAARTLAALNGIELRTVGFDISHTLLRTHRLRNNSVVVGDALRLPFGDGGIDVVMCSQVLHHFREPQAIELIRELNRVARARVVISDLRRSLIAAGGLWVASFVLRFHSVSRHDGVVSIMRGFVPDELSELVQSSIGLRPVARRRIGYRVTTSWKPQ
jgi:2-polyprenyl-3-methyl-5-hydroxy-6-metoxy-1,4-benzoquinol methylase